MRIALRSTLALVTVYLVVIGGFAWWVEHEIRNVATSLMEETARLVGSEVAAAMSGPALDQLLQGDAPTRLRLVQLVADLGQRSDLVASIAVVDAQGEVVVSDELEVGHQLALPGVVFQNAMRPQLLHSNQPFDGATYYLYVPLLRDAQAVGYIRLSLRSQQFSRLFRHERRQLALAALAGLTAIGLLGFLLQVQLRRRSQELAATLMATARGETPPSALRDDFSHALDAAGRLGRELNAERERSTSAQRRMSALANFMDVGVIMLGRDERPEFANASALELLGCDGAHSLDQGWEAVRPYYHEALQRLRGEDQHTQADIDIIEATKTRHLRLEVHRQSDEHEGGVALIKDRDMLEAFETELRLATQMRGLARVYSALAHELRAPLGAMALNLELLSDTLAEDAENNERPMRYARVLQEELTRLNRSLLMLLNQTTAVDDKSDLFDIGSLLRDLEALLGPQAKRQKVKLDIHVPTQEIHLSGHRDRLKQALLNLSTNALEAMPDGGRLELELENCGDKARVVVRDTGPGIPAEVRDKIFGLYFTTKPSGSGIGLYVTRSIVEAHGGELHCNSTPGAGACFEIDLPLTSRPEA